MDLFDLCFHVSDRYQGKPGQELTTATWRQELKQKPVTNAAYRFAPQGLLNLFFCTTQDLLAEDDCP